MSNNLMNDFEIVNVKCAGMQTVCRDYECQTKIMNDDSIQFELSADVDKLEDSDMFRMMLSDFISDIRSNLGGKIKITAKAKGEGC